MFVCSKRMTPNPTLLDIKGGFSPSSSFFSYQLHSASAFFLSTTLLSSSAFFLTHTHSHTHTHTYICIYICPEPAATRDPLLTHPSPFCSRANDYLGYLLAHAPLLFFYIFYLLFPIFLLLSRTRPLCLSLTSLYSLVIYFYRYSLGSLDDD